MWPFYIEKILSNFGMHDSKPVASPVNPGTKLAACKDSDNVSNQLLYHALVGSLLYLSTRTRPDIAYAVSSVLVIVLTQLMTSYSSKDNFEIFKWDS